VQAGRWSKSLLGHLELLALRSRCSSGSSWRNVSIGRCEQPVTRALRIGPSRPWLGASRRRSGPQVSGEASRPASGGTYCWFSERYNSRLCGAGPALVVQSFLQPAIAAPDASIQVAALPLVPLLPGEFAPIPAEAAPGEPSTPLVPLVVFAFPVPFAPPRGRPSAASRAYG
jgi:hypothetical protein